MFAAVSLAVCLLFASASASDVEAQYASATVPATAYDATTPVPSEAAPAYQQQTTETEAATSYNQLVFHGYYAGGCTQDGFYVNGPYSLVVCSNGRAHVQPCAPGTRNAAVHAYVPGASYQQTDFCNENLNNYAGNAPAVVTVAAAAAGIPYYPVLHPYYPAAYYHAPYQYVLH